MNEGKRLKEFNNSYLIKTKEECEKEWEKKQKIVSILKNEFPIQSAGVDLIIIAGQILKIAEE